MFDLQSNRITADGVQQSDLPLISDEQLQWAAFEEFMANDQLKAIYLRLSQFSFAKLRQPTGQTFFLNSQRNFPISFKPKVAIAKFV
jgi:hypothetical protein